MSISGVESERLEVVSGDAAAGVEIARESPLTAIIRDARKIMIVPLLTMDLS
jgi:hypothetical protein